jgi:hypothetical protein
MIKSNVPPIISGAAHPVGRIEHVEVGGASHIVARKTQSDFLSALQEP